MVLEVPQPAGDAGQILVRYRDHLTREKGLAYSTVAGYQTVARQFFNGFARRPEADLSKLSASVVTDFVLESTEHRPTGTTKHRVTALRSLLSFLHLEGLSPNLVGAVPKVAGWRGAALPRGVASVDFERLLEGCDTATATGRRDRALLMLLGRLGMRVGEVVRLDLADIDWRRAELTVRGKARRDERIPLPVDVGEALADHILNGRGGGPAGPVFFGDESRSRPWTTTRVRSALEAACHRAGVEHVLPHALRHMAATEMLRAGASLIEVGQVLRHRSLSTTAIYTKVDVEPLRELARPWPVQ